MESARIVRFEQGGQIGYGLLEGETVYRLDGDPFGQFSRGMAVGPAAQVPLLAPVAPSKIVAIGLNYLDHITEDAHGFEKPENPIIFLKPPSALVGSGADIVLPPGAEQVDSEAELAVVIGKQARNVPAAEAYDYILGLTCSNDVSARDYQFKDGQWARAKGFDTFAPLGPAIVTGVRADDLAITCRLNGEVRQQSSTNMLIFGIPALIEFITRVMTLEPGDVIMTGTPAHPPRMSPGDVVEIEIEHLGTLRNQAVAE